ncbi:hypothetical protein PVAG01_03806 [Phlyctema vagabunda]|uniref:Zn(2)-C6 fungal-type domain-containing protein n=1 Tax=Phlyctema vagabunda TaxID=108571 RepID=A0ABR4PMG4_9HELO
MSLSPNDNGISSITATAFPKASPTLPSSNTQTARRRPGACEGCRSRKSKCDGGKPMCWTCKERDITCVYKKKSKNRGRRGTVSRRTESQNEQLTSRQSLASTFAGPNEHSNSSLSEPIAVPETPVPLPLWDFESIIIQTPQQDLNWFDIENIDAFTEINKTQQQYLDSPPGFSDHVTSLEDSHQLPAGDGHHVEILPTQLLENSSLVLGNEHGTDLLTRSLYHNAEKALRELLYSDIMNSDQHQIRNSQYDDLQCAEDPNLLKLYLAASVNNAFLYTAFLDSEFLNQLFAEVTTQNSLDKSKIAIVYTILAAGCQLHWGTGPQNDLNKGREGAATLFSKTFGCSEVISETASPLVFQALLSMSIFLIQWEPSQASKMLAKTVACAQHLKLNQAQSFTNLGLNNKQQICLKRAFWLLYSIEKLHNMRLGSFSVSAQKTRRNNAGETNNRIYVNGYNN